jgi:hypothetical protein
MKKNDLDGAYQRPPIRPKPTKCLKCPLRVQDGCPFNKFTNKPWRKCELYDNEPRLIELAMNGDGYLTHSPIPKPHFCNVCKYYIVGTPSSCLKFWQYKKNGTCKEFVDTRIEDNNGN